MIQADTMSCMDASTRATMHSVVKEWREQGVKLCLAEPLASKDALAVMAFWTVVTCASSSTSTTPLPSIASQALYSRIKTWHNNTADQPHDTVQSEAHPV